MMAMAGSPLNEAQFTGHSGSHQKTAPTPFFTDIFWKQGTYIYILVHCHFQVVVDSIFCQRLLEMGHTLAHTLGAIQSIPQRHFLHPSSLSCPGRQQLTAVMALTVSISLKTENMLAITLEVIEHILNVHVLEAGRILIDCHS